MAMRIYVQVMHKVQYRVGGCTAVQVLARIRKEADNMTVWRPQQQLHERNLAHFNLCV